MPLFFFISGYLFNEKKYFCINLKEYIFLKFKRLIIPYFGMAFICYIIVIFSGLKNEYILKYIIGILYSRGTVEWLPNCSPLWFLTCLFVVEIIIYLILKRKNKLIYFFFLIILGGILSNFLLIKLPWNIDTALVGAVFALIGFFVKKNNIFYKIKNNKYEWFFFVVFIWCSYISVLFNKNGVDFDGNKYGDYFYFYLGAFSGILIIFFICMKINSIKICSFFGKNTMPIIGFNYMFMSVSLRISKYLFVEVNWIYNFIITIFFTAMCIYILVKIKNKNKLVSKIFFGE